MIGTRILIWLITIVAFVLLICYLTVYEYGIHYYIAIDNEDLNFKECENDTCTLLDMTTLERTTQSKKIGEEILLNIPIKLF